MTEWQWAIVDIAVVVFESVFLYYWYFSEKFRFRFSGVKKWLLMAVFPFTTYLLNLLMDEPSVRMFILLIIGSIVVRILYQCTIFQSLIAHIIFMLLLVVSESVAMGFLIFVHGFGGTSMFLENSFLRIQCLLLSKLINVILIVFFIKVLKTEKREYTLKEVLVLLLQSFSSILCLIMIVEFSYYQTEDFSWHMLFLVFLGIAVLVSYIVFYYLIDGYFAYQEREKEILLIEMKNEKIISDYKLLENSQQKIYQVYHDLKKHLNIINMMNNKTEINEYLEKCFENIKEIDGRFQTGNQYIDMFLYSEWRKASELGIKVQFAVQGGSLEQIELHDIIVILGNALENACEACKKRLEKQEKAYMQLKIVKIDNQVFIVISNNYSGKIDQKGGIFVTSKKDKGMHGIGMKSMRSSVEKYKGDMNVSLKNGKFTLKIMLNVSTVN